MNLWAGPFFAALLEGLWMGLLLTAIVWALLRAMPRLNSATRYAIWWVALWAVLVLPLSRLQPPPSRATFMASPAGEPVTATAAATEPIVVTPSPEPVQPPASRDRLFPLRLSLGSWPLVALAAWSLFSLGMLSCLAIGYWSLRARKNGLRSVPQHYEDRFRFWLANGAVRRSVRLAISDDIGTPMAAGLWRPVILVPHGLLEQLSEQEFDQVCLHELAHVRRWDDWALLVQRLIEAVLGFLPAVFWIGRQLQLEREIACDDWVVAQTGNVRPSSNPSAPPAPTSPPASASATSLSPRKT